MSGPSDHDADEMGKKIQALEEALEIFRNDNDRLKQEKADIESLYSDALDDLKFAEFQLDNLNSVVLRWDPSGRVMYLNEFGKKLFGYSNQEIIGKSIVGTIIAETDSAGRDLKYMIEDIVKNPQKYRKNENENITKDGQRLWMLWRNKPIRNSDGTLREILTVGYDITEKKQEEKALRESQKLLDTGLHNLRVALSSMSDGIYILDGDLNIVTFNQRYVDLLNFPEGLVKEGESIVNVIEFAAKRGDYGSHIDGDIDDVVAARLKQLESGEEYFFENITPTGRIVEYRASPVKGGGFVAIMHDITERKQAEQALGESQKLLDTILDNMPFTVFVRDLDGRFMLINRSYEELMQVTKAGVQGMTLHELFTKEEADGYSTLDSEVARERRVLEREETHQLPDGEHTMVVVKFPIFDISDEVVAVGGIDLDITERKRAEGKLVDKEEQLRIAINGMPSGIVYTDEDLNIVIANDRLAEMYGAPIELLEAGRPYAGFFRYLSEQDFFGQVDADVFVAQRIEDLRNPTGEVSERRTPDGRLFEIRRQPVHGGGAIAVVTDVTDERQAADKINTQAEVLLEMSTPITEIWNGILLLPVIGELDRDRARKIMNAVLERITLTSSKIVILDISGLSTVDEEVLPHIVMIADAMRLMGSQCILSGVSPTNAKLIVDIGIDVDALFTVASIREALAHGIKRLEHRL